MTDIIVFLAAPFAGCVLVVAMLGYLGIHVLEREIIFIDIALAQVAAVGYAVAIIMLGHEAVENGSLAAELVAVGATVAAGLFYSLVGRRDIGISQETVIGVSYAIAAALTLFILALSAGGEVHLEQMLTGSILWLQWREIVVTGVVFLAVGAFHAVYRSRFLDIDPGTGAISLAATAHGLLWDFLFYASMGIVITRSVRIAGVLMTFCMLIIPTTIGALFARRLSRRILLGWGVGMAVCVAGLAASYRFDLSTGPAIVALLGASLILAGAVSRLVRGVIRG